MGFLPLPATACIYLYSHPPSRQSRIYRATQLGTYRAHRLDASGAMPVIPKVVSVMGAAFSGMISHWTDFLCTSLFPHPSLVQTVWTRYVCTVELCMYVWSSQIARVRINRVRLPILLVVSWTEEMNYFLSPFAPENLVSRDGFGCPVPRQPAHLHTPAESGAYLRNSSRVPRRRSSSCLDSFYSSKGNISHCCSPRYGFRKKQARGTFCWPTRPSIQLVQR